MNHASDSMSSASRQHEANPGELDGASAAGVFTWLTAEAVIHVAGEDAADYLHSQFSSDIRNAKPGTSLLTSYSDPRGRLLAILRVLPLSETEFALVVDHGVLPTIIAQLRKYALRARVTSTESSWAVAGVIGEAAGARLTANGLRMASDEAEQAWSIGDTVSVRLPDPQPRWLLLGPRPSLDEAAATLASMLHPADATVWRRREIESGLPRITATTSSRFVAQMVNLDRLGAVDFTKGCYPGQEVVARTHYLGRIKRRMYIVDIPAGPVPAAGDGVYDADGGSIGEIVTATDDGNGGIALAVLRLDAAAGELRVGAPDGPAGLAREPAYGLDHAA